MRFHVANGLGESIDAPTAEQMRAVLFAVDASDEEHGAAWLATDDDVLEWNGDGRLVFHIVGHYVSRHLVDVSRERALALWLVLAAGRVDDRETEDWREGDGYEPTEAKRAAMQAALANVDRTFYDQLGPERPDVPCKRAGCPRGAIELSVLCRPHHFASIQGKPCPFDD